MNYFDISGISDYIFDIRNIILAYEKRSKYKEFENMKNKLQKGNNFQTWNKVCLNEKLPEDFGAYLYEKKMISRNLMYSKTKLSENFLNNEIENYEREIIRDNR